MISGADHDDQAHRAEVWGPEPTAFRRVLGHFPTGVVVVAAIGQDGRPAGMAVGSFVSVSLEPPLVAFFPDRRSTSWPRMREASSFCVNVLGHDQEDVCRIFATSGGDKFATIGWHPAPSGAPVVDGALAWIDCLPYSVTEVGDHYLIVGRVLDLAVQGSSLPLLFFQGGYGRFHPLSLTAWHDDLGLQIHLADLARPELESLAEQLGRECLATAVVGDEMVLLVSAGAAGQTAMPTAVGQRFPFRAPVGTVFVAWADSPTQAAWICESARNDAGRARALRGTLAAVRSRGYSMGRGSAWHEQVVAMVAAVRPGMAPPRDHAAELRATMREWPADYESPDSTATGWLTISVPVFDSSGQVVMALTVAGPGDGPVPASTIQQITDTASRVTAALRASSQPVAAAPEPAQ